MDRTDLHYQHERVTKTQNNLKMESRTNRARGGESVRRSTFELIVVVIHQYRCGHWCVSAALL